jgi:hypothetical protein
MPSVLTIRERQMHLLQESNRQEFVERAVHIIAMNWPHFSRKFDAGEFRGLVSGLIDQALSSGFTTEVLALRFVNLAASFGGDFPGPRTWAERLLKDRRRDGGTRMDLLVQRAYGELVERV